jgi:carboxylesterase
MNPGARRSAVVALHGLGGTPASLGDIPSNLRGAGHLVVTPILPGHGGEISLLDGVSRFDWIESLTAAIDDVAVAGLPVVVIGQSLGGTLALHAAATDARIAGIVTINAPVGPSDPDVVEHLEWLLARGTIRQPAGAPDIADPAAVDVAHTEHSVGSLLELVRLCDEVTSLLPAVSAPVLVVSSAHDGVVDPSTAQVIADGVSGPVERLVLQRSRHVACLDFDRHLLGESLASWLERVSHD